MVAFQSFQLTNNNAKLKAAQKRLKSIEAMQDAEPVRIEHEGVCIYIENPELARVQLLFDGKPSDAVRAVLKAQGFRWAPSEKAWQRHLNNAGRWAAKQAIKGIESI